MKEVRFYLERDLRKSAEAGQHNFIGQIASVLQSTGLTVTYRETPRAGKGWSLTHMKPPPDAQGLVFRRVYHYPFWQIDQTDKRWDWDTANAPFDGGSVNRQEADRFFGFWQKRLFGDSALQTQKDGIVYVPLQGRLLQHRSFQSCSPLEMIQNCLAHDTKRQIIATLHPKERYTNAEITALERLEAKHPRLDVRMGEMDTLLQRCDYIVTQNSSAAFSGMFFGKPTLRFAKVDFHHITVAADLDDLAGGFEAVQIHAPDYAGYLHWFWQQRSINAGRPEALDRIAERLRRFGWPV